MTLVHATPATHRQELQEAEERLQSALARIPTDQAATWSAHPSGLSGWTRNHVVAHLLGNVDGLLNLVSWAFSGVRTPMYASPEARQQAIDERSQWPLADLVAALTARATEYAEACEGLREPLNSHDLQLGSGASIEAWELPMIRIRELEIHQVDLADGYLPSDWSPAFTLRTMGQVQPAMAARGTLPVSRLRATDTGRCWDCAPTGPELWGEETQLLAWLLGRPHAGLHVDDPRPDADGAVPVAPTWV